MTRAELFRVLLAAADDDHCVFDQAELDRWPAGALGEFQRLGLLRPASGRLMAPCPNCADGHVEPVEPRAAPDGATRFFIYCPVALRVEVDPESCRGWEIDPNGLAAVVARALDLSGRPKDVMPGWLWRLGRIPWDGKTREVLFARRLGDPDAASVTVHVGPGGRSIVLVPHHVPDERIWPNRTPPVVALSRIASVGDGGVMIDGVALMESVAEADQSAQDGGQIPLDAVAANKVRKHVKATIETMISSEALVQAYRVHGSYRKAADALNAEGYLTNRWAVERAVRAAGGARVVKAEEDSASVARSVASHSRDRSKKFLERR